MPPSTATCVRVAALDGHDGVERHARAADHRTPRLDDQANLRIEVVAQRAHRRLGVLGHRGRALAGGVGDPEPAAEVVDREAAEAGDGLRGAAEAHEIE